MDGFIGEIRLMALSFAPEGWFYCDGTSYSINAYGALYAVIGTIYGGSSSTFNVPDLRGAMAVGVGAVGGADPFVPVLNSHGGMTNVTLDFTTMPSHGHDLVGAMALPPKRVATGAGNWIASPAAIATPVEAGDGFTNVTPTNPVALAPATLCGVGSSGAHSNMQPYLCLQYFICWSGEFPIRP